MSKRRWGLRGRVTVFMPGRIRRIMRLLPTVAVVTHMMRDHYSAFRPPNAIAAEKGDLVVLKASGSVDHPRRPILSYSGGIACWRMHCGRFIHCCRFAWRRAPGGVRTSRPPAQLL